MNASSAFALAAFGLVAPAALADTNPPPEGTPAPSFFMTWDSEQDNNGSPNPFTYDANQFASAPTEWGTWNLGGTIDPDSGLVMDGSPRTRTGWRYRGGLENTDWSFSWDCVVNEDPFVDTTINVVNNSNVTQTFWVYMPLMINPAVTPGSLMSGSVSAVVSDGNFDGASLATNGVDAIYSAFIDPAMVNDPGAIVRTQWNPGFSLNAAPFGANNDTDSFANEVGPQALTSIALRLRFTLTAGDSASVTGLFDIQPVPAPAGLALLAGLGAVFTRGRRRV